MNFWILEAWKLKKAFTNLKQIANFSKSLKFKHKIFFV